MMTATNAPLQAYRSAAVDASVAAASPHQLILMLFEGARVALAQARRALARNDVACRGQAIAKAVAIIDDGLRASLDVSKGGALGGQLEALYEYMALQLALGNAEGKPGRLDEVDRLLAELEAGWREIGGAPSRAAPVAAEPPAQRSPQSYGKA